MRILHVISTLSPSAGGPPVGVLAMARAVAALGHDVRIQATDHGMTAEEVRSASDVKDGLVQVALHRHIPPAAYTRHASIGLWRAVAAEIRECDVVHLHSLYMFHDWVVWRECRRAGVPYILQPHGSLDPFLHQRHRWRKTICEMLFQDRVTSDATYVQFTTEMERDLAQPYVFGRPGVVVPLGVDLKRFDVLPPPAQFRARHPEIGDRRIVLFLGRLNFKKGLEILIPAFAAALARRQDLHLVVAGPDGGFEARARALVVEHGLQNHTTFTKNLDAERVNEAFAAADVFVLPSRTENFAIAAAEAIAAGVPSLLSEEVQIASAAADAGACRTVPLEIPAWTEALLDLLADPEAARLMSSRARKYAGETFAWAAIASEQVRIYEQAAAVSRSGHV